MTDDDNKKTFQDLFDMIIPKFNNEIIEDMEKPFTLLTNNTKAKESKASKREQMRRIKLNTKKIGATKKRDINFFDIEYNNIVYDKYLPLHQLWLEYIKDLTNDLQNANCQVLASKIIKADLQGAIIQVTRSKNPTYIGQKGIIIQETESTFKIITQENKLNVILKEVCEFHLEFYNFSTTIYGKHFSFRNYERAVKKFKSRVNIELD
ncbi:RNase P protein subunit [Tieghemostelium lacteum]|uniref:Ribonuclease P protein subunit p29 n=1 Tax=Tieghemostelium lacteum TaxID=361077 RepID=A0A151Z4S4_TIELA|nr:RNase P protein subunit [Tieghemostelium lacteum]|eukprot:KYQ88938.1 RNase P protein subunit [Tieghemostelium lacteum]